MEAAGGLRSVVRDTGSSALGSAGTALKQVCSRPLSLCVVHNFEEFSLHLQTRDSIRTLAAQKYTLRIVPGEILLAEATIEVQGVAMSDALPA